LTSEQPTPRDTTRGQVFATTHWTAVLAAGRGNTPQAHVALEELCRTYWYPLYVYVRRRGHSRDDAKDLTQAFFERFLEKNYLDGLSGERGRFRAFLLASMNHFLANEWDRASCQKRGGGSVPLSLDWQDADARYEIDPVDQLSPDKLYDRTWAVTLLERVLARLRAENTGEGRAAVFEALKLFLTAGKGATPYVEAASALKISETAARVAVHRLRARYRELLRVEIGQTLSDPAQVDEELRALFNAFST
jgi:DNA-directed RNA polymerase specialized sigma24 family protein